MEIEKPVTLDILDTAGTPALSSTSDMPVVETKPDAEQAAPTHDPVDKTPAESATAEPPEEPSASPEAAKPAKGVQKRLDELTKQREDEKRRALAAEERLDRALAALEKATGKAEEPKKLDTEDPEPARPVKSSFDDLDRYEAALLDYSDQKAAWTAKREVKAARAEDERKQLERQMTQEKQSAQNAYRSRKEKAMEKYADFAEVAESPSVAISGVMAQAIILSEDGPELQYYFGKNPDEAKRLMTLNPYVQVVELGKIAAKLKEPAAKPQVSGAPKPIKPMTTSGDVSSKPLEELPMEEYAAKRKAELAKQRPGTRH